MFDVYTCGVGVYSHISCHKETIYVKRHTNIMLFRYRIYGAEQPTRTNHAKGISRFMRSVNIWGMKMGALFRRCVFGFSFFSADL